MNKFVQYWMSDKEKNVRSLLDSRSHISSHLSHPRIPGDIRRSISEPSVVGYDGGVRSLQQRPRRYFERTHALYANHRRSLRQVGLGKIISAQVRKELVMRLSRFVGQ